MSAAAHPSVLVLCPDSDVPTGGVQVMYRHVEDLVAQGISAAVLHERPGFRCSWFTSTAPVVSSALRPVTALDVLVVPEIYGPHLHELAPGTPKVILNQNAYLTFTGWPLPATGVPEPVPGAAPYLAPEVVATLCVSDDNREYLEHAFPGLTVHRLVYAVTALDDPPAQEDVITYMPRKNAEHARQVLSILRQRDALAGFRVDAIDGVPHAESVRRLARGRVFLSFGAPEGCGLPVMEAMAAGAVVIGYHGGGGREHLTEATGYPVAFGEVLEFARTVEAVLTDLRAGTEEPGRRAAAGRALVRRRYTDAEARRSTAEAWEVILAAAGAEHVRADEPVPESFAVAVDAAGRRAVDRVTALEGELAGARAAADAARAEAEALRAEAEALRASRSWRITAPVRRATDAVRRVFSPSGPR